MAQLQGFTGDFQGLSKQQVQNALAQHGANTLTASARKPLVLRILSFLAEPMFLLLIGTATIYFLLGEVRDGMIMITFVLFMAGINLFEQFKTDKALQALKQMASPKVQVVRQGSVQTIESQALVVGDLMILHEGDKVSADGQVLEMFDLAVDESMLTGESDVVWKTAQASPEESAQAWRKDYVYAGTMVTQGGAVVRVSAGGDKTTYGQIGLSLAKVAPTHTPLEKQTRALVKVAALIGVVLFALVMVFTFLRLANAPLAQRLIDSLLAGITLAMAMIPEEFPVILTVFLAMGAWRLAKKNALIRRMAAAETLGAVSVLCVDKTGTLTQNKMTLQRTQPFLCEQQDLLRVAALACERAPYDPMEKAILDYAQQNGVDTQSEFERDMVHEYAFSNETKMMGHVWQDADKKWVTAKGSVESILPLCGLQPKEHEGVLKQVADLAAQGFRVLAVAQARETRALPERLEQVDLQLLGLLGLSDPPREGVAGALKMCHQAGVRVVMITGDSGQTAAAIGRALGLSKTPNVLTGEDVEGMDDAALREAVKKTHIFSRVVPHHKLRVVQALKDNGEVVAMTGDGVNDAPALKCADIGIAMGKRGTEVAKEAADMVLLDDDFSTIVSSVADGRRIYDNIKKAVGYVLVVHIPIALIALLSPLLGVPLMLLPIHIVLLELIIDPTCSILFERQPAEDDLMTRPPRNPKGSLVDRGLLGKSLAQGISIFVAGFGSYYGLLSMGAQVPLARSFALVVMVFANLFLVYVNQSDHMGFWHIIKHARDDKVILGVNLAVVLVILAAIYLPFGNNIVKTQPLNLWWLLLALLLGVASVLWWEVVKIFKRRRAKKLLRTDETE